MVVSCLRCAFSPTMQAMFALITSLRVAKYMYNLTVIHENEPNSSIQIVHLRYSLLVDDKDKQEKKRPSSAAASTTSVSSPKSFYYGGSPSSSFKNFTGCISYAYINR